MKIKTLFLLLLVLFPYLDTHASEISTQISDIEISPKAYESSLVFLSSGDVAKVPPGKNLLLDQLLAAMKNESWIKVILNDEREITFIQIIVSPIPPEPEAYLSYEKSLMEIEQPTVLNSLSLAQRIFDGARYQHQESQCFNRAHVWSYEWKTKSRINTAKMFIFFSTRYIRENDFEWWFHVAPYVHVAINKEIKERIMDRKYMKGPSKVSEWINRFMKDGTQCRTVKVYSEYANYPESGDCYLMRTSMYTYWPLDLELEEITGVRKKTWMTEEIKSAYSEAFHTTY